MTPKYDSSYDREQATALAQKLHRRFRQSRGIPRMVVEDEPMAARSISTTEPRPRPSAPSVSFDDRDVYREDVWRALLDWAIELSASRWACVSDQRGLIIAEQGDKGDLETEETASRIASAVHSLKHSTGEATVPSIVSLRASGGWITALSCPFENPSHEKSHLIISLVGSASPVAELSEKIRDVFSEKISTF